MISIASDTSNIKCLFVCLFIYMVVLNHPHYPSHKVLFQRNDAQFVKRKKKSPFPQDLNMSKLSCLLTIIASLTLGSHTGSWWLLGEQREPQLYPN